MKTGIVTATMQIIVVAKKKKPTQVFQHILFNFTNIMPEEFCAEEEMTRADMLQKKYVA